MELSEFEAQIDRFPAAVCSAMQRVCEGQSQVAQDNFEDDQPCGACKSQDVEIISYRAGSTIVNFKIWQRPPDGPPIPVLRSFFLWLLPDFLEELGDEGFPAVEGAEPPATTTVIIGALSADALTAKLVSETFAGALNIFFALDGTWGLVLLWALTTRGANCRDRTRKRGLLARILPSSETLQVLLLAVFFQLVCSNVFHKYLGTSTMLHVILVGVAVGWIGMVFVFLLNSWIRGRTFSLGDMHKIEVYGPVMAYEGEEEVDREYAKCYEAGQKGRRALGQLAAHDWEGSHMQWEKAQGLVDFSDNIFDVAPEHDTGVVAQFLNSSLLSAFGFGPDKKAAPVAPHNPNFDPCEVSVSKTISRHLRDAMLQWRLRHTAHPVEAEAANAVLGQLDPNFRVLAVEVPGQARIMVVQAMLQWIQRHAMLQLDAAHAARMQMVLEQLAPRFDGMSLVLPLDDKGGTEAVRALLTDALRSKIETKTKKELTQEDGQMLQYALQQLAPSFALLTMDKPVVITEDEPDKPQQDLEAEIQHLALAVEDKIDDDDLYSSVLLVQQVEPPEVVNPIKPKGKVAASPPPSPAMPEIRRGAFLSPPPSPPASAELPDWRREAMAFLENEGDTGGGLSAGEEAEEAPTARMQAIKVPVVAPPAPEPLAARSIRDNPFMQGNAGPAASSIQDNPFMQGNARPVRPVRPVRRGFDEEKAPAITLQARRDAQAKARREAEERAKRQAEEAQAPQETEERAERQRQAEAQAQVETEAEAEAQLRAKAEVEAKAKAKAEEPAPKPPVAAVRAVEIPAVPPGVAEPSALEPPTAERVVEDPAVVTPVAQPLAVGLPDGIPPLAKAPEVAPAAMPPAAEARAAPGPAPESLTPRPAPVEVPGEDAAASVDELAAMEAAKVQPKLGRRRRKRREPNEKRMPCWKQYTMLLLGSILVGVSNVASITWMATMEPLQANVRLPSTRCLLLSHATTCRARAAQLIPIRSRWAGCSDFMGHWLAVLFHLPQIDAHAHPLLAQVSPALNMPASGTAFHAQCNPESSLIVPALPGGVRCSAASQPKGRYRRTLSCSWRKGARIFRR